MRAHENPFRTSRVRSLAYRGPVSIDQLRLRLESHGLRGAIVGPEGSGKSTLLRELAERLGAAGLRTRLVRFDDAAQLRRRDPRTILMIDGAEMLPWIVQAGLALVHRRLAVTAHRAYPGLPLLLQAQASPRSLDELICELVGAEDPCRQRANALFSDKRGDIRAVFGALYDDLASDRLELLAKDRPAVVAHLD